MNKRGFTLVELLVVVAMIAVIMGAISTSFSAARTRANIQKATSEVKVMSQAIIAYATWNKDALDPMEDEPASGRSLSFLLGRGSASGVSGASSSGEIPVLLMAKLQSGGEILDPWGTQYRVTVRKGSANLSFKTVNSNLRTGYFLPNINLYRTTEAE